MAGHSGIQNHSVRRKRQGEEVELTVRGGGVGGDTSADDCDECGKRKHGQLDQPQCAGEKEQAPKNSCEARGMPADGATERGRAPGKQRRSDELVREADEGHEGSTRGC